MLQITHQEHKKSAHLHQAAEVPWRLFCSGIALPHIDPCGSRHLTVSNGRLPDSVSRVTPDANIILRELSRNLHVFFRICHAEKETEARYRQVLQNRGSTNSSERGTLASVTPRARLLKLSEVPYLLKWGFKPCCKLPVSADLSGIWKDLPEFKFSSLLKSHWTNFTSAVVLAHKEIK